jgi:lipopolysaccharide transport protein LptA
MRLRALLIGLSLGIAGALSAQDAAAPKEAPAAPAKKAGKPAKEDSPANKLFGADSTKPGESITTEIYSDEAFFDSNKSIGIFTGHVKVTDPRFNLQSDKLTVFISKGENQGLERALAEGNVGVVRDRPDPAGGPPTRAVGRSDKANYIAATGNVELTGTPRVQQGLNTHIATSADTVMVINQSGQLTTHGPSRTDIRQEPKDGEEGKSDEAKSEAKPEKKPEEKKDKGHKKSKFLNAHG